MFYLFVYLTAAIIHSISFIVSNFFFTQAQAQAQALNHKNLKFSSSSSIILFLITMNCFLLTTAITTASITVVVIIETQHFRRPFLFITRYIVKNSLERLRLIEGFTTVSIILVGVEILAHVLFARHGQ